MNKLKVALYCLLTLTIASALAQGPAVVGPTEAFVDWTPVTLFTNGDTITAPVEYRLETLAPGSSNWVRVVNVSNSSYLVTGLTAGLHSYRVVTVVEGIAAESLPSEVVSKTIAAAPLQPRKTTPISIR